MGREQRKITQCDNSAMISEMSVALSAQDWPLTQWLFRRREWPQFCKRVNPYKAPGPDGLKGRVLKECATTTKVSQLLLNSKSFSQAWKTAAIIPVPKNPHVKTNNYFRPIALTPFLRKCMEHLVRDELSRQVAGSLELMQFPYRNNRGMEDATLTLLNSIYNHQNKCNTHACILFMDSFSALNTV